MDISQQRRKTIITAIVAGLLLIVVLFMVFVQRLGKIELNLMIAPQTAKITIDGKPAKVGINYVKPGEHTVEISKENFNTSKITQNFSANETLRVGLSPTNPAGRQTALLREADYLELEQEAGEEAQVAGEAFAKSNPIINRLPHETSYYSINYSISKNDPNRIVVEIDAKSVIGRRVALEKIRSWGFDLSEYEFNFVGFNNPFAKKARN